MGRLWFGTSSWYERSWVGAFYPDGTPPADYLPFYAREFRTVEADVTYYRVPDRELCGGWSARTPEGFVLSAKFPRSIVHGGDSARPDPTRLLCPDATAADLDQFLDAMAVLGPKCGPLVLQFPYFNRVVFASPRPFLDRLDRFLARLPATFRYGVEVRNKAWLGPDLLAILRRHRAALVLVEIGHLPHPAWLQARRDLVTTDFVYARLIGDRQAVDERTDRFDRIVLDRSASLERWADLIASCRDRVADVYCYANNHYAGHGPATIRDLARRVALRIDAAQAPPGAPEP
jgi:uncharacterized protein YecE (DUF72 family)